jgi:hypothetical protein
MDRDKEEAEFPILDKSLPAHWRERSVRQPVDSGWFVIIGLLSAVRRQVEKIAPGIDIRGQQLNEVSAKD